MRGRLAPLAVRPFNRLLSSYTLNELGDSVGIVALAVLVFDRTEAVVPTAAFFVAAKFLPALVAPALTARFDQVALRRSLPALYLIEALVFAALALIAHGDFVLGLVLALGLVDGALAITARALTRGAVATVLQPARLLKEGNALMNIGFAISSVGGAALAGLLIAQFSVATALLVDAASFLAIAILLALTRGLPAANLGREAFWERFNAGIRFARTNALVRMLLIGEAIALVLFTLIIPIEVIYAKESLNTTSAGFGILLASWGAGIVVGSLIYLLVKHRSAITLIMISTARSAPPTSAWRRPTRCSSRAWSRSSAAPATASSGSPWSPHCRKRRRPTTRRGSWAFSNRWARRCRASATCWGARWLRSARPAPRTRSPEPACCCSSSPRSCSGRASTGRPDARRASRTSRTAICRSRSRSRPPHARPSLSANAPRALNLT